MVGCDASEEDNLFLFKINDENIIEETPQVLKGHLKPISGVAFHPSGRAIVSVSADDVICLRAIDSNNEVKKPSFLDAIGIKEIKNLCFNHDGTLLVCSGMKDDKVPYILVWKFDTDGTPNRRPAEHTISEMVRIHDISWLPKTNKCFIGGNGQYSNNAGLLLYDMSEENRAIHKVENYENDCSYVQVSPDGTMIIVGKNDNNHFDLFSLYNNGLALNHLAQLGKWSDEFSNFLFTPDSCQITNIWKGMHGNGGIRIRTLINQQEKDILQLSGLDSYQLLLLDKVLSKDNFDDALDYLKKNNVPDAIINQLQKLSTPHKQPSVQPQQESQQTSSTKKVEPSVQPQQESQQKPPTKEVEIPVQQPSQEIAKPSSTKEYFLFISKLWNLAKAYWPGSKQ